MRKKVDKKFMDNFEWLNSLYSIPSSNWHFDRVIKISDIENIVFYDHEISSGQMEINPFQIKGIKYDDDYNNSQEINWLQLFNMLRRFDEIRSNIITHEGLVAHAKNDYN